MERCGALRLADRPSISQICDELRLIAERAVEAEARQPLAAQPRATPLGRRTRGAVQEEEEDQLSTEMDEGAGSSSVLSRCSSSASTALTTAQHSHAVNESSGSESPACPLCHGAFRNHRTMLAHQRSGCDQHQRPEAIAASSQQSTAELEMQHRPKRARIDRPAASLRPDACTQSNGVDHVKQAEAIVQRRLLADDGERAARLLADRFPADGHGWALSVWARSFWQKLPPHIQREVSSGGSAQTAAACS